MLKALSTNTLVNHPSYGKILHAYNLELREKGKVNNLDFYRRVIVPEIPTYNQQSWYFFLKRFKIESGLLAVSPKTDDPVSIVDSNIKRTPTVIGTENELSVTMLSNKDATAQAIQKMLNIGNARLNEILANPQLMTAKEAIDLITKAMKAQDSRIHAIGKVREDNREEEKLNRAFDDASYSN